MGWLTDLGNFTFGTAGSAGQDAANRQRAIMGEYQGAVSGALSPYESLSSVGQAQGAQSALLQALQGSNPMQYSVDPRAYAQSAPDVSAGAVRSFLDPAMDYEMQQAQGAIEESAAGRGGLFSGAAGRELQQARQGLARTGWSNAFDRARTAGLDANAARQGTFGQLLGAGQFNSGLMAQRLGNLGSAYNTTMAPINMLAQNRMDMANTMLGAQTGLNQQQMQGQYADRGVFSDLLGAGAQILSQR